VCTHWASVLTEADVIPQNLNHRRSDIFVPFWNLANDAQLERPHRFCNPLRSGFLLHRLHRGGQQQSSRQWRRWAPATSRFRGRTKTFTSNNRLVKWPTNKADKYNFVSLDVKRVFASNVSNILYVNMSAMLGWHYIIPNEMKHKNQQNNRFIGDQFPELTQHY
jgi:hypothetical protein